MQLAVLTFSDAFCAFCFIRTISDLEEAYDCDTIDLAGDMNVMRHSKLFRTIKDVIRFENLRLIDTNLEYMTERENVTIVTSAIIKDNMKLKKLPKLIFLKTGNPNVTVLGNPMLDTTDLRNYCEQVQCRDSVMARIQMPFPCKYERPLPSQCRNVYGVVDLAEPDSSLDQIESVTGTLVLNSTNFESFPVMKNLRSLRQHDQDPVLVVENNANLTSMKSLYKVDIKVNRTGVRFVNNPRLCVIEKEIDEEMFVLKYLGTFKKCGGQNSSNRLEILTAQLLMVTIVPLASALIA